MANIERRGGRDRRGRDADDLQLQAALIAPDGPTPSRFCRKRAPGRARHEGWKSTTTLHPARSLAGRTFAFHLRAAPDPFGQIGQCRVVAPHGPSPPCRYHPAHVRGSRDRHRLGVLASALLAARAPSLLRRWLEQQSAQAVGLRAVAASAPLKQQRVARRRPGGRHHNRAQIVDHGQRQGPVCRGRPCGAVSGTP